MKFTKVPVTIAALLFGLVLVFGLACESRDGQAVAVEQAPAAVSDIVATAVAVAKEIEAEPDDVEAVLKRHGLDVERFEKLMYEISSDPLLSKAYTAALE